MPVRTEAIKRESPNEPERAKRFEPPNAHERANAEETPKPGERAKFKEAPKRRERAIPVETPNGGERAKRGEAPTRSERAIGREPPTPRERAMIVETPKPVERATRTESPSPVERANGHEAPSSIERRFTAARISVNKQEVREQLYDDVSMTFPSGTRRFGMLAGGKPRQEIDQIMRRFVWPEITAFDVVPEAIEAAQLCGVESVLGNVTFGKTLEGREFDFFDLDLCRSATTHARTIQNVARHCRFGMSVFASYSRDEKELKEAAWWARNFRASQGEPPTGTERAIGVEAPTGAERATREESPAYMEQAIGSEAPMVRERAIPAEAPKYSERVNTGESPKADERQHLLSLPDTQLGRVLLMASIVIAARPNAQLVRAYAYKGGEGGEGMPMYGALFRFAKRAPCLPPFRPIYEPATAVREMRLLRAGLRDRQIRQRLTRGG